MSNQNSNNLTEQLLDNTASLTDLFEENNMEPDIENNEPLLFQNSPYYRIPDFKKLLDTKSNNFSILSLNCQSLNAKFDQLKTYIEMYNTDDFKICAICLQETWLAAESDLSLLQIDGYQLISAGKSSSAHGGVAIYLHDSFSYTIYDCNINSDIFDMQFIEILIENGQNDSKTLLLGNLYRPPRQTSENVNTFINQFNLLSSKLISFKHVVLTGDFNLDLLKFKENNLVNDYLDSILSNSFIPKITLPTRITQRKGTLIDNILVKISNEYSITTSGILINRISDHLPCFTCLDYLNFNKNSTRYIKIIPQFTNSAINMKADLNNFSVERSLNNILRNNPNESYRNFTDIISPLMNKHFQVKKIRYNKHRHKKSKWMTHGIMRSIAYRDKMYIKLKSLKINDIEYPANKANFTTYNNILKKTIRAAKKQYYENCFHKFKSDVKKTWSTINDIIGKTKKASDFPRYFLINGQQIDDNLTIAEEFNQFFVNVGPKLAESIQAPPLSSFEEYLGDPKNKRFEFQAISIEAVMQAIDSLKPKTSYGCDRMTNKLVKFLKFELAPPLTSIINQSMSYGLFPDSLKIAKVTPLYKKDENYLMNNYRPISILPSVSKVFERVMHNQIYQYFTSNSLFYKSQYGFRKGHSTEFAALELIDRITIEMDKNKLPINIYMDLSKAFDTLDHHILLHKLRYYGFNIKSMELMESYLTNRTQYVEYNGVTSTLSNVYCGVPQGSILGPLLFIIYMNDLPSIAKNFEMILYADDTTLSASLSNLENEKDNVKKLNVELESVSKWLKLNKLSLNLAKTKAMLFHTPQRQVLYPELKIDGLNIEFVTKFNFLGLIVNENLKWNCHVEAISKKISRAIGVMARLKNFIPKSAMLHIYNALILSHLSYGLIVWNHESEILIGLQKKAIKIACNAKYNSHTSVLFKNENILKFKDLCALDDFKFCYKFAHDLLPNYFEKLSAVNEHRHQYITRQLGELRVPAVRHEFARGSITYRYPEIYNAMDDDFKEKIFTLSFFGFKFYIKRNMIDKYPTTCEIPDCYNCN